MCVCGGGGGGGGGGSCACKERDMPGDIALTEGMGSRERESGLGGGVSTSLKFINRTFS